MNQVGEPARDVYIVNHDIRFNHHCGSVHANKACSRVVSTGGKGTENAGRLG